MREYYVPFTQSDHGEDLQFTLQDSSGTAVNLTNASTVEILVQRPNTDALAFTGTMTVITAAEGTVKYTVQSTDLDQAGKYFATIRVTFNDGKVLSFPNIIIDVTPQLPK